MLGLGARRSKTIVHVGAGSPAEREAVLVLLGLGNIFFDWQSLARFYIGATDYDVFVPDYFDYHSIDASVRKLDDFVRQAQLERYRRVHVFAYILGGWVFNTWLRSHSLPNIASIIYDRSPIQELAPTYFSDISERVVALVAGAVTVDLGRTPYPPSDKSSAKIGIMIESRATVYMRLFRKKLNVSWAAGDLRQAHDDACYVWLDHYEMYKRFDVIGGDILHFFQHGRFSEGARRQPFERDPFAR